MFKSFTSLCLFTALLASAGLSAAAAPAASGPSDSGFSLGVRLGYGIPLGESVANTTFSDSVSGMLPLGLDVGYRFTPNLYLGLYGQYGVVFFTDKGCSTGASCSGYDLRGGLNLHYRFIPSGPVDPWVGIGIGWEHFGENISTTVLNTKHELNASINGPEFVNLQFGVDFLATPAFGIGPFLSFSAAQYTSSSVKFDSSETSGDVKNQAVHEWLSFGVRGVYDF